MGTRKKYGQGCYGAMVFVGVDDLIDMNQAWIARKGDQGMAIDKHIFLGFHLHIFKRLCIAPFWEVNHGVALLICTILGI